MAPSTRTARSRSASGWLRWSSQDGCGSAAIGIPAAASRSTCSGRPDDCRKTCGCPTRTSRPTVAAAEAARGRGRPRIRQRAPAAPCRLPKDLARLLLHVARPLVVERQTMKRSDLTEKLLDLKREKGL